MIVVKEQRVLRMSQCVTGEPVLTRFLAFFERRERLTKTNRRLYNIEKQEPNNEDCRPNFNAEKFKGHGEFCRNGKIPGKLKKQSPCPVQKTLNSVDLRS